MHTHNRESITYIRYMHCTSGSTHQVSVSSDLGYACEGHLDTWGGLEGCVVHQAPAASDRSHAPHTQSTSVAGEPPSSSCTLVACRLSTPHHWEGDREMYAQNEVTITLWFACRLLICEFVMLLIYTDGLIWSICVTSLPDHPPRHALDVETRQVGDSGGEVGDRKLVREAPVAPAERKRHLPRVPVKVCGTINPMWQRITVSTI
jgi:hypothetical protein